MYADLGEPSTSGFYMMVTFDLILCIVWYYNGIIMLYFTLIYLILIFSEYAVSPQWIPR